MKLTRTQILKLRRISNDIDKILDNERAKHHDGEEPKHDEVYNELNATIGSIQSAIELDLKYHYAKLGIN